MGIDRPNAVKWLRRQFVEWTKWSSIRTIGQAPAMKSVILIPLVGYLIIFSKELSEVFVPFLEENSEFEEALASTQTKLIFIYLGLLFLSIGQLIYIFSPSEIKKYRDSISYKNAMWDLPRNDRYDLAKQICQYVFPSLIPSEFNKTGNPTLFSRASINNNYFESIAKSGYVNIVRPIKIAGRKDNSNGLNMHNILNNIAEDQERSSELFMRWYEAKDYSSSVARYIVLA
ncbi:MAG: hypothetical protein ACLFV8_05040, partial [Alphaproteobacteria bacterium]